MSAISSEIDALKVIKLNLLVIVFSFVIILLIYEYRKSQNHSPPGLLTNIEKK